ncbi:MAG: hypothetical protein COA43_07890 [Robiginitomaculum sp.]|nr:MAG: hypothetical protein COA43_07890 [Robiginitomaculum sp.]
MIGKAIIISVMGTGLLGTGASVGTPTGIEIAAGPLHIESGNGKIFNARFDNGSGISLTITLKDERNLILKF